mgnify:CR=1 FL=1
MSMKTRNKRSKKTGNWYYRLELSKKTSLWGILFLLPWLLGFLLFFLKPLVETILYSFSTVNVVEGGIDLDFIGWKNYIHAFTIDTVFNRLILTMLTKTFPQVLIVIIFSLLAAVLINGQYPGRSIARTIFFIPIIMGTNIAEATLTGRGVVSQELAGGSVAKAFGSGIILDVLANAGLPVEIVGYVSGAVSGIFSILAISGVPTLIFLAGLQSISPSLYEVARMEGATSYETFWKVTLPMVSPMVLVCTIYSIIDAFFRHSILINGTRYGIVAWMRDVAFSQANYGLSAAMAVVYMAVSILLVALVSYLISKVVFYYD